jgi:hypothetical protein
MSAPAIFKYSKDCSLLAIELAAVLLIKQY